MQKAVSGFKRHENPVDIKECNECGAPLSGTMCQSCMIKDAKNASDLKKVLKRT